MTVYARPFTFSFNPHCQPSLQIGLITEVNLQGQICLDGGCSTQTILIQSPHTQSQCNTGLELHDPNELREPFILNQ